MPGPQSQGGEPPPTIYYVDDDAPPGGNGLSWATAFNLLQTALAVGGGQGIVRIGAGTYYPDRLDPNQPQLGTGDRMTSFTAGAVRLEGGYAGYGAPNPDENRPGLYKTILSGDIGLPGDRADNSYHVLRLTAGGPILTGITIRGGHADYSVDGEHQRGGGILATSNDLVLTQCVIVDNCARHSGGGIHFTGPSAPPSVVMLTSCVVARNTAHNGGGLFIDAPASTWSGNCVTIADNIAVLGGGVWFGPGAGGVLRNSIVWGNYATLDRSISIPNPAALVLEYVGIEDGWSGPGTNVFDGDPRFTPGTWRLGDDSPYLDIGKVFGAGNFDVDGGPRIFDLPTVPNGPSGPIDLGAYELYPDCDHDFIDDVKEIATCAGDPACGDCNGNDIPDGCDITSGDSDDADVDGIPDECDATYAGGCCVTGVCEMQTQHGCTQAGGAWVGAGTSCNADTCQFVACCFMPAGNCLMLLQFDCVQAGGTPQDPNSTCAQVSCPVGSGACCTGSACEIAPGNACSGVFLGYGTACDAATCLGACCDTQNFECQHVYQNTCNSLGGDFFGIGTNCNSVGCSPPAGACCFGFDCIDGYTASACDFDGGIYAGDNTACTTFPCGIPPYGACCVGAQCLYPLSSSDCALEGGTYLGNGSNCLSLPCAQLGACCLPGGACERRTDANCIAGAGVFYGLGVPCAAGLCGPGACCMGILDSGCVETDIATCRNGPGYYLGPTVECTPDDPCFGACCVDGVCQMTNPVACASLGGIWRGAGSNCANQTCYGACCVCAGVCVDTPDEAHCDAFGGVFLSYSATCTVGSTCLPATGACCTAQGNCEVRPALECAQLGGTYQGDGATCGPTTCGSLTGACCTLLGSCLINTAAECGQLAGSYQGDGTSCGIDTCPANGACCLSGLCIDSAPVNICFALGGVIIGAGVTCAPNICDTPVGACCGPPDACYEEFTENVCRAAGGQWGGAGVTCAATGCMPGGGACCALGLSGIPVCIFSDEAGCTANSGTFLGIGTSCVDTVCPGTGACCVQQGACFEVTPDMCTPGAGVFLGQGVACSSGLCDLVPTGACCNAGTCQPDVAPFNCMFGGGAYLGNDSTCDGDPCNAPRGACCVLTVGSCLETTTAGCAATGGLYSGDGTLCVGVTCPEGGACCFGDICAPDSLYYACVSAGGSFLGVGSTCNGNACDAPTGACRVVAIGYICFEDTTETICLANHGVWQGPDSHCNDGGGVSGTGACCFGGPDGTDRCIVTSESICVDEALGTYLGSGTSCAGATCAATGACCLSGYCYEMTNVGCTLVGGAYQGNASSCSPTTCGPLTGACCYPAGCQDDQTAAECAAGNGTFYGPGATCDPNTCRVGACCIGQDCEYVAEPACSGSSGTFLGGGVPCSAIVCADCNGNSVPDALDISGGTSADCNLNGVPDECDIVTNGAAIIRHRVRTWIDGRDHLIVRASSVCWQHFDFNLPGWEGGNFPTYVDAFAWIPDWSGGTGYGAMCAPYTALFAGAPLADATVSLNVIRARHSVAVVQQPSAGNNYTLKIEFNDDPLGGADWYELDIFWSFNGVASQDCNDNDVPDECDISSGYSQDANQNGIPDECEIPPATGACCFGDGSCGVKSPSECSQLGGAYQGDNTPCDPNPCPPAGACCGAVIVYGAQPATNLIIKLNPTTGEIVDSFAPPTAAAMQPAHVNIGLAMGAGVLYYVNSHAAPNTIFELDPASGETVRTTRLAPPAPDEDHGERDIDVGNWSFGGLAYGAGRLFINHGQSDLHMVELDGDETYYWGASMRPTRAIGGDGSERFFVRNTAGAIVELSAASNVAATNALPAPASDVEGLAFAGSTLYASTASGLLYRLDPNDGDVLSQLTVPGGPLFGLAASGSFDECATLTQSACGQAGGTWKGAGTTCDDRDSDGVADLCEPPPPTGACCAASGSCSVRTENDCAAQSGVYRGDGTTCEPNPCPQPPPPTGACCAANGSCSVLTASDCAAQDGAYRGDGTTCEPNPCPQPPPPTGACCAANGSCSVLTASDCAAQGGVYRGDGTTCEPNPCPQPPPPPGACCRPTGACASAADAAACTALGGVFQGAGTSCASIVCPVDPCALDADGDGTNNCVDGCPNDPAKTAPGTCGCGVPDVDTDGDLLLDCVDNCPTVANADQADFDADGLGSACDSDEPGRPDPNLPASDFVRGLVDLLSGRETDADFDQNLADLTTTVDGQPGNRLEELDDSGRPLPDPNAAAAAREIEDLAISLGICPTATVMIVSTALVGVLLVRRRQGP